MSPLFFIFHIMICVFLIVVVLFQSGKNMTVNSTFGGGNSFLKNTGSSSFITKFTIIVAILFIVSSLNLAFWVNKEESFSIMKESPTLTKEISPSQIIVK